MNKDIEYRHFGCEFRSVDEGENNRIVEGYAAVFNSDSADMGFVERIMPGAFDGVIENSDVLALMNHDVNRGVLARSKFGVGSLELSVDENGLRYRFQAPNTALGDELLENLRRGEVDSSSFAFTIEHDEWIDIGVNGAEKWQRNIHKIKALYDVSPVYTPAYPSTSCATRSLEAHKQNLIIEKQNKELDKIFKKI